MTARRGRGYRYGRWHGGPDPLAAPYDLGNAVDEIGDSVLGGSGVREALRELLRRGTEGRRGLDELRRSVRERLRRARTAGRMDGTLQEVRELLDQALSAERRELFPDPDDSARLAEAELDALPDDTAGAVRALKEYPWRSDEARQAYDKIQDLLRREVLDSSFASMKQALENASAADMQAVKDMVADLSQLVDAHNRGEDTDQQFRDFMDKHGQFFPDDPQSIEELIDSLARRAAAQERMMAGLSPEQRAELADLMNQAMSDMGLASEMAHLQDALRQARPDLPWGQRGQVPDGEPSLGLGDATSAVAELADLEALSNQLSQGYATAVVASPMPRACSPSGTCPRWPQGRSGRAWRRASCRWAISLASPMSAMVWAIRSDSSARCSGESPAIIRSCAAARRARESISSSTDCGSSGKNWPCLSMKSRNRSSVSSPRLCASINCDRSATMSLTACRSSSVAFSSACFIEAKELSSTSRRSRSWICS